MVAVLCVTGIRRERRPRHRRERNFGAGLEGGYRGGGVYRRIIDLKGVALEAGSNNDVAANAVGAEEGCAESVLTFNHCRGKINFVTRSECERGGGELNRSGCICESGNDELIRIPNGDGLSGVSGNGLDARDTERVIRQINHFCHLTLDRGDNTRNIGHRCGLGKTGKGDGGVGRDEKGI